MKKILFVCIENSNRSQMAQAFAKIHGKGKVEAFSAGSAPSGIVNPKAIAAMAELGYDLSTHDSKSTEDYRDVAFDYVITMGCGDACPYVPAKHRLDWNLQDPRHMNEVEFRGVRDNIQERVKAFLAEAGF